MSDETRGRANLLKESLIRCRANALRPIEYVRGLPESAQVAIWSGAVLLAIALTIVVYAYGAALAQALGIACAAALVVALVGAAIRVGLHLRRAPHAARLAASAMRSQADALEVPCTVALLEQRAARLKAIHEGNVKPRTESVDLLLRNSEALWFHCPASITDRKGQSWPGQLYVTSLRVSFVCLECPMDVPIGNVNAVQQQGRSLHLIGRSAGSTEEFAVSDPELTAAYIAHAVRAYHRQVDVGFESDASRHVPQDVKTVVWQRDGGRCIECGATDYLEFDHVIPHAKGGATSVENLQLLCRRCNLKKRDAI